ncbi:MAG: PUA domain-containing protein [Desulfurococcaceae archaeon]
MIIRKPTKSELLELREIARLQFSIPGEFLIPDNVHVSVSPNTNRIRFILINGSRYLSIRSRDYRFNLYLPAGRVLNSILPHPRLRVYVKRDYTEFVSKGETLFSRHVLMADPDIRPGDEVLVVDPSGKLLAVGRTRLAGWEMTYYNRGEAVKIREGVLECQNLSH